MNPIGSISAATSSRSELGAEDPVHLAHPHLRVPRLGAQRLGAGVDGAGVDDEVGARLGEQLGEAGRREIDGVRIDVALEPHRGVAAQARCA